MTHSILTDTEFDQLSHRLISRIEAIFDDWLENDVVDVDTQRTGGVLEIEFEDKSKIVINTQKPLHEIWLASKLSGRHFRFDGQHWVDTKDGQSFWQALTSAATFHAKKELTLTHS